jgi:aminoglycoside phosphotransferase (APT) family kinase protein
MVWRKKFLGGVLVKRRKKLEPADDVNPNQPKDSMSLKGEYEHLTSEEERSQKVVSSSNDVTSSSIQQPDVLLSETISKRKLVELTTQTFSVHASQLEIELMEGGSFNGVIGLHIFYSPQKVEKYVVRIPRFKEGAHTLLQDVATLEAVDARVSYPTPQVIAYDPKSTNVLGRAYMIQRRLEGDNLRDVWKHLNMAQRRSVTREVTKLCSDIVAIKWNSAGKFVFWDGKPEIVDFPVGEDGSRSSTIKPASETTPYKCMVLMCDRWADWQYDYDEDNMVIWKAFKAIAKSLYKRGFLPDDEGFALKHGDLMSWNLLVTVIDEQSVEISGVIDWDFATVAPKCMYVKPSWLWCDDTAPMVKDFGDSSNDKIQYHQELEAIWKNGTGSELLRYAEAPGCSVARGIFKLLRQGTSAYSHLRIAASIIQDWDAMHPEDRVGCQAKSFVSIHGAKNRQL